MVGFFCTGVTVRGIKKLKNIGHCYLEACEIKVPLYCTILNIKMLITKFPPMCKVFALRKHIIRTVFNEINNNNLKWNDHVSESIKKANKRLYFLVMLKRAGVPLKDIVAFYTTAIRPVLEYCSPVFHHALPKYLCNDIERVQKRALSIIMPNNSYEASLVNFNLTTLQARREQQCFKLFDSISGDHKLSGLVPLPKNCNYNLRNKIKYLMPRFHTDRFRLSFIPAMCSRFLSS